MNSLKSLLKSDFLLLSSIALAGIFPELMMDKCVENSNVLNSCTCMTHVDATQAHSQSPILSIGIYWGFLALIFFVILFL